MAFDLAATIADDLDGFDGLEKVEFVTRRTDASGDADDTVYGNVDALPSEVSFNDMALLEIDSQGTGRVWHVKVNLLTDLGIDPRQGDEIRQCDAAGTKWAIMSIQLRTLGTRYRFVCHQGES